MQTSRRRRVAARLAGYAAALAVLSGVAFAHSGTLRNAAPERLAVPTWLFLATGGGVVGASFLLASFVTDRAFIRSVHDQVARIPAPGTVLAWVGRGVGLAGLGVVLWLGLAGPASGVRNGAILVVWVAWWAGYTMSTYLLTNSWPVVNPWRTLAGLLPTLDRTYPDRLGSWPAVVGLLGLVWVEIVSPLADDPRLLAGVVAVYTVGTLVGAAAFGDDWFRRVDPVSRVFALYGRVAPIQRTDDGLAITLPGAALTTNPLDGVDDVAFVVALLWGTTYDGLVSTPAWADLTRSVVSAGVPPHLFYLLALVAGFGGFLGVYLLAARLARRTAPTYVSVRELGRRFAPALLPIAAGYHLAHFLGYFLALSPALVSVLLDPLSPVQNPPVLVLPGWFGGLSLAFVLLGHLLAVWVAHAIAYDLFPGRLQAVRSQYALTLVMVAYTMTSLWIVSRPTVAPPYL
ncbi:hypothetical protein ACFQH6_08725 [Halobacteriaceae archaeon GCM10025711]